MGPTGPKARGDHPTPTQKTFFELFQRFKAREPFVELGRPAIMGLRPASRAAVPGELVDIVDTVDTAGIVYTVENVTSVDNGSSVDSIHKFQAMDGPPMANSVRTSQAKW